MQPPQGYVPLSDSDSSALILAAPKHLSKSTHAMTSPSNFSFIPSTPTSSHHPPYHSTKVYNDFSQTDLAPTHRKVSFQQTIIQQEELFSQKTYFLDNLAFTVEELQQFATNVAQKYTYHSTFARTLDQDIQDQQAKNMENSNVLQEISAQIDKLKSFLAEVEHREPIACLTLLQDQEVLSHAKTLLQQLSQFSTPGSTAFSSPSLVTTMHQLRNYLSQMKTRIYQIQSLVHPQLQHKYQHQTSTLLPACQNSFYFVENQFHSKNDALSSLKSTNTELLTQVQHFSTQLLSIKTANDNKTQLQTNYTSITQSFCDAGTEFINILHKIFNLQSLINDYQDQLSHLENQSKKLGDNISNLTHQLDIIHDQTTQSIFTINDQSNNITQQITSAREAITRADVDDFAATFVQIGDQFAQLGVFQALDADTPIESLQNAINQMQPFQTSLDHFCFDVIQKLSQLETEWNTSTEELDQFLIKLFFQQQQISHLISLTFNEYHSLVETDQAISSQTSAAGYPYISPVELTTLMNAVASQRHLIDEQNQNVLPALEAKLALFLTQHQQLSCIEQNYLSECTQKNALLQFQIDSQQVEMAQQEEQIKLFEANYLDAQLQYNLATQLSQSYVDANNVVLSQLNQLQEPLSQLTLLEAAIAKRLEQLMEVKTKRVNLRNEKNAEECRIRKEFEDANEQELEAEALLAQLTPQLRTIQHNSLDNNLDTDVDKSLVELPFSPKSQTTQSNQNNTANKLENVKPIKSIIKKTTISFNDFPLFKSPPLPPRYASLQNDDSDHMDDLTFHNTMYNQQNTTMYQNVIDSIESPTISFHSSQELQIVSSEHKSHLTNDTFDTLHDRDEDPHPTSQTIMGDQQTILESPLTLSSNLLHSHKSAQAPPTAPLQTKFPEEEEEELDHSSSYSTPKLSSYSDIVDKVPHISHHIPITPKRSLKRSLKRVNDEEAFESFILASPTPIDFKSTTSHKTTCPQSEQQEIRSINLAASTLRGINSVDSYTQINQTNARNHIPAGSILRSRQASSTQVSFRPLISAQPIKLPQRLFFASPQTQQQNQLVQTASAVAEPVSNIITTTPSISAEIKDSKVKPTRGRKSISKDCLPSAKSTYKPVKTPSKQDDTTTKQTIKTPSKQDDKTPKQTIKIEDTIITKSKKTKSRSKQSLSDYETPDFFTSSLPKSAIKIKTKTKVLTKQPLDDSDQEIDQTMKKGYSKPNEPVYTSQPSTMHDFDTEDENYSSKFSQQQHLYHSAPLPAALKHPSSSSDHPQSSYIARSNYMHVAVVPTTPKMSINVLTPSDMSADPKTPKSQSHSYTQNNTKPTSLAMKSMYSQRQQDHPIYQHQNQSGGGILGSSRKLHPPPTSHRQTAFGGLPYHHALLNPPITQHPQSMLNGSQNKPPPQGSLFGKTAAIALTKSYTGLHQRGLSLQSKFNKKI